ncbi:MAG: hypothetical protein ACJ741_19375 [Pyrinomonadaceae bacterium]
MDNSFSASGSASKNPAKPSRPDPATGRALEVTAESRTAPLEATINVLLDKLQPVVRAAAREAAAREHERTRVWLESRGLPKAARVAQREAYDVLRQYGVVAPTRKNGKGLNVGRADDAATEAARLSAEEVAEFAEICVSMLATQSQPIDATLAEMSVEAGGFLLPTDAPRVRALADEIARARNLC